MRIAPAFNVTPMSAAGAGGLGTMGAAIMQAPEFQQQLTKARFANPMALQALLQQMTKTRFLPGQLQADIFSKESPALTQLALHPIINNSIAGEIQNLMKFNPNDPLGAMYAQNFLNSLTQSGTPGGGMPQVGGQPTATPFRGKPSDAGQPSQPSESPGVSGSQIATHIKAQMAGLTSPHEVSHINQQINALENLQSMLPALATKAKNYGGLLGMAESLFNPDAANFSSQLGSAQKLADQGGLGQEHTSFWNKLMSNQYVKRLATGSETSKELANMQKNVAQRIAQLQEQGKKATVGGLITQPYQSMQQGGGQTSKSVNKQPAANAAAQQSSPYAGEKMVNPKLGPNQKIVTYNGIRGILDKNSYTFTPL